MRTSQVVSGKVVYAAVKLCIALLGIHHRLVNNYCYPFHVKWDLFMRTLSRCCTVIIFCYSIMKAILSSTNTQMCP